MQIIKQGDTNTTRTTKYFSCGYCGCEFTAEFSEYVQADYIESVHDNIEAKCRCPFCKKMVYKHSGG